MIPEKETLVFLENLQRKQVRIFGDSCDVGIYETKEIRNSLRSACEKLKRTYGGKAKAWSTGVSWETFIPFEHDEGFEKGVNVRVARHDLKKKKPFFSIDITPNARPL